MTLLPPSSRSGLQGSNVLTHTDVNTADLKITMSKLFLNVLKPTFTDLFYVKSTLHLKKSFLTPVFIAGLHVRTVSISLLLKSHED